MSIDRIGKGPGLSPGITPPASTGPVGVKQPFSVQSATPTEAASELGPADQVRAGQMDMSTYLDVRVEQATHHLQGKLGEADLAQVRSMLRSQLASDPTLRDMVHQATGALPPSESD